jgi:hypothetical protein
MNKIKYPKSNKINETDVECRFQNVLHQNRYKQQQASNIIHKKPNIIKCTIIDYSFFHSNISTDTSTTKFLMITKITPTHK